MTEEIPEIVPLGVGGEEGALEKRSADLTAYSVGKSSSKRKLFSLTMTFQNTVICNNK